MTTNKENHFLMRLWDSLNEARQHFSCVIGEDDYRKMPHISDLCFVKVRQWGRECVERVPAISQNSPWGAPREPLSGTKTPCVALCVCLPFSECVGQWERGQVLKQLKLKTSADAWLPCFHWSHYKMLQNTRSCPFSSYYLHYENATSPKLSLV